MDPSLIEKFEDEIARLKFCLTYVSITRWHVAMNQVISTKDILISYVLVATSTCVSIIMCINMHCHSLALKSTAWT